eukprot:COSAG01_NODE_27081_length_695_cov_0.887584_1_plen_100_part_10
MRPAGYQTGMVLCTATSRLLAPLAVILLLTDDPLLRGAGGGVGMLPAHAAAPRSPSKAAVERAAAHVRNSPPVEAGWSKWLAKATDQVRGHRRWGHVLDA